MRTVDTKEIEACVYRLALEAGRNLSPSCLNALTEARDRETGSAARFALDTVLQNAEVAKRETMPVCQDTGMACVFLSIGQEVHLTGKSLSEAIHEGVRRAYSDGCFRKSICDPLTRVNTADNTPAAIHTQIVPGDKVELSFLPKGFGSENMSRLFMLTPAAGRKGIIDSVVSAVKEAGSKPCPPVYIGVGIGGSFDTVALLAKRALLREIGTRHPRKDVASIEEELLTKINALGIGAQGFHGDTAALGVSCEIAPTHIAGLPVAVNVQCHCVRVAKEVL
ncbi:MAG: fumarate hydratase [Clostridia bacterium]|nr:fumarate hydratase [Clostridia bacterium]